MTDATQTLVDHALGLEWKTLPPAAQAATRAFLFDTVCVGVAGASAANADKVWRAVQGWTGAAGSRILGRPDLSLPAPYAAFVNAFQIHAQEYDCVHEAAVAHPMATVVAALLAEADRSGPYDGETFLTALAAGVDVVATLGVAATTPLKFFRPATCGVFGSVAAVARLRRLDRPVVINAFGYALAYASGSMQAHVEGKPALALQVGGAARSAIEAIDLAIAGLEGPTQSIDGRFGYLTLFEDAVDLPPALDSLKTGSRISELSWKPFPTGRAAQGAIVALQEMMRDQGLKADTLDRFIYRAPPLIARLVGRRPLAGMDVAYARLCFAYLGATTLLTGTVGLTDFSPEALNDPQRLALAERLWVESDEGPDPAAFVPATANARTFSGQMLSADVTVQFGSPAWPLSRSDRFAKARACLAFAGEAFGDLAALPEPLAFIHDRFETVSDVSQTLAAVYGAHAAGSGSATTATSAKPDQVASPAGLNEAPRRPTRSTTPP